MKAKSSFFNTFKRISPCIFLSAFLTECLFSSPEHFKLSWPTPNPAFAKGQGYSAFLQKTGPDKDFSSGAFGCVRNNGYKFHEGIDLYPLRRDSKGRAIDNVFSSMRGKVTYINRTTGHSAYGKYLVMEHREQGICLYSLYAHLASIEPGLSIGSIVEVASPLGKMGNTASFSIPLSRSHLHFEIGLRLTSDFQKWFDRQSFKTPNHHGNFSGFNLVGIDPIPFYSAYQAKSFKSPLEYFKNLPSVVNVRVKSTRVPDFAKRNPGLFPRIQENNLFHAWDCSFGPFGIPIRLSPSKKPLPGKQIVQITSFDSSVQNKPCRQLVKNYSGQFQLSKQLKVYLELLFGITLA